MASKWGSGPGQVETQTLSIGLHDHDEERHFEVFFAVDDLETALGQVTGHGGSITSEVHETPGFGRWVECADDQGVRFGLRQQSAS